MTPAPRILIIDDEKTFRVVAQAALAAEGFEARSAASGGEGLALARELRPEVVVLDRNLPDALGARKTRATSWKGSSPRARATRRSS